MAKIKGDYDEESRRRENAKQSLERYMHYFERWDAHHRARDKVRTGRGGAEGNAKRSLELYMHHFECWDAHHRARDKVGWVGEWVIDGDPGEWVGGWGGGGGSEAKRMRAR